MSNSTDFDKIYLNQGKISGRFRIADSGLGWRSSQKGGSTATANPEKLKPFLLSADELSSIQWSRGCKGYELKINTRNEGVVQLDGFNQEDFNLVKNEFLRRFNITVEVKEHSLRGWNWGQTDMARNEMVFSVNGKPTFEIPYSRINNTNLTSKNEVAVEFQINNETYQPAGDEIVEMRFFVPSTIIKGEGEDEDEDMDKEGQKVKGEGEEGNDGSDQENEDEDAAIVDRKTMAESFYEELKAKADIGEVSGDAIVSFQDVFFTTPRGRYDIDIYKNSIRLRGKTYEYKLQHNQIQKIFSLPKADDLHHNMVLAIDPPIRQGQTTYPFLVLQFDNNEETEVQLNVEDDEFEELYKDKLMKQYDAKTHMVLSHVLKGVTGRKVIVAGGYVSKFEQAAVSCSLKANEGYLYPLENSFLFLTKPTLYIPYSDISLVSISRAGDSSSTARTFDLEIILRGNKGTTTFGNISKEEQQGLETFLKSKNLRVKNEEKEVQHRLNTVLAGSDDDSDINMGSAGEEDETPDEDFHVSDDEDGDVAEEFDSDAPVSGSESEAGDPDADDDVIGDDDLDEDRPAKKQKL
ncbi:FACT complex subunit [Hanseniaspora osmophila]|uniref:FACT complex subunit POB3 n=1 Tax=Hanseniaspora osmophila TaxID=56408 RepID=A0A1E5RI41_9ASCO|nr:FACT complex subunit POB3 [Hanseniaspora osmophila]